MQCAKRVPRVRHAVQRRHRYGYHRIVDRGVRLRIERHGVAGIRARMHARMCAIALTRGVFRSASAAIAESVGAWADGLITVAGPEPELDRSRARMLDRALEAVSGKA
jgi:hypothetical protein